MKLYELSVGQRFTFIDKHRGKVFEIIKVHTVEKARRPATIVFKDVATGEQRTAAANRKTFRMEVELVTANRVVDLTLDDIEILKSALVESYLKACEIGRQSTDGEKINTLMLKITGLHGRRVVLPEGE